MLRWMTGRPASHISHIGKRSLAAALFLHPALSLVFVSCGTAPPGKRAAGPAELTTPLRYSIVCVIHGDGSYLYHDTSGTAHRADGTVLTRMKRVGERNDRAEVFIFHQRPRRRFLFIFPRSDGTMYHYRRGRLVSKEDYRRTGGPERFTPEARLFEEARTAPVDGGMSVFLYFGHEIPEDGGRGYDSSHGGWTFSPEDLARGLEELSAGGGAFDLAVLSTCHGGTVRTIGALSPLAGYIVASPGDLHLSHLDVSLLEDAEAMSRAGAAAALADLFARRAFDALRGFVQTSITVAVYDAAAVRGYVESTAAPYDSAAAEAADERGSFERCDCAEIKGFLLPGMNEGVTIYYRLPAFGPLKRKDSHSGWECWRAKNPRSG